MNKPGMCRGCVKRLQEAGEEAEAMRMNSHLKPLRDSLFDTASTQSGYFHRIITVTPSASCNVVGESSGR